MAARPTTPPKSVLLAARDALQAGHISDAHAALDQAESALRKVPPEAGGGGAQAERAVLDIGVAEHALAISDQAHALDAIDDALVSVRAGSATATDVATPSPPPAPTETYAWFPGHWTPQGSGYVWIPPDTVGRLVVGRTWVPDHWVWRDGQYVWVPAHWEN